MNCAFQRDSFAHAFPSSAYFLTRHIVRFIVNGQVKTIINNTLKIEARISNFHPHQDCSGDNLLVISFLSLN